ncbi:ParB/RepB/Spo0J family partition protein [Gandjariella thermophila]|uniref:ParB-like N-terminal domain-containing protein n=1 Tax=Gandjariella thermophila TaxID=1931992 RepID=A0A4D4JHI5_9PSEU|nr:streptomycin biosynthesis protein [Gandjariella thermophila]GDY33856.1 hypothetical protein GTS_54890 [Gandjariella thermophila]
MAVTTGALSAEASTMDPNTTVIRVPISSLKPADSPRLEGEDEAHVKVLAEIATTLPPILVHRRTMRVVDGMHRLRAAVLRGEDSIAVEFFDGDDADVFVRAVQANISHGLPLSLRDRKAAAARIAATRPNLSDRAIARVAGLSPKTVATVRRRSSDGTPHSDRRVGRDGRLRPLDASAGRAAAEDLIRSRPNASLREIARSAGISVSTARDVRQRIEHAREPAPSADRNAVNSPHRGTSGGSDVDRVDAETNLSDFTSVVPMLMKDPSLKFTGPGRALLRLLAAHAMGPTDWERLIEAVPPHCISVVGDLASVYARAWERLGTELKRRRTDMS